MDLTFDVETRSKAKLKTEGMSKYARDPSTDLTCMAWKRNGTPLVEDNVRGWLKGKDPELFIEDARNADRIYAHNAGFEKHIWEQVCVKRYGWPEIDPGKWRCTAAAAAYRNGPRSLDAACKVFGIKLRKDEEGNKVMMKTCQPTKSGEWVEDLETLRRVLLYCKRDVLAEEALHRHVGDLPESELPVWQHDREINELGLPIDVDLCQSAFELITLIGDKAGRILSEITGGTIDASTQRERILNWLQEQGLNIPNLKADTVTEFLADKTLSMEVLDVLKCRRQGAPASVRKYNAALKRVDNDGRAREQILYYGANATGRYSGMGIQPHNFFREPVPTPEFLVDAIKSKDLDLLEAVCDEPVELLQNTVRGMVCAEPGKTLVYSDFGAIEARMLGWICSSKRMMNVFREFDSGDGFEPYILEASKIFKVKPENVVKQQRQIGKVAVLALGYGQGVTSYVATCLDWTGIKVETSIGEKVVDSYRRSHPEVVKLWRVMEDCYKQIVKGKDRVQATRSGIWFFKDGDDVVMELPSGRSLFYRKAKISRKGVSSINSYGNRQNMWGGHLVENATQALARDCLTASMLRCRAAGLSVVGHIHDECILEVPQEEVEEAKQKLEAAMLTPPEWCPELPLAIDTIVAKRLRKE